MTTTITDLGRSGGIPRVITPPVPGALAVFDFTQGTLHQRLQNKVDLRAPDGVLRFVGSRPTDNPWLPLGDGVTVGSQIILPAEHTMITVARATADDDDLGAALGAKRPTWIANSDENAPSAAGEGSFIRMSTAAAPDLGRVQGRVTRGTPGGLSTQTRVMTVSATLAGMRNFRFLAMAAGNNGVTLYDKTADVTNTQSSAVPMFAVPRQVLIGGPHEQTGSPAAVRGPNDTALALLYPGRLTDGQIVTLHQWARALLAPSGAAFEGL